MNCSIINRKIQLLLQETDMTFNMVIDAGGHPNMDYADYTASTRIDCFRSALQNPDLSRAQLASVMRRSLRGQQSRKAQETYWSAFMASYISRNANGNGAFE